MISKAFVLALFLLLTGETIPGALAATSVVANQNMESPSAVTSHVRNVRNVEISSKQWLFLLHIYICKCFK